MSLIDDDFVKAEVLSQLSSTALGRLQGRFKKRIVELDEWVEAIRSLQSEGKPLDESEESSTG